MIAFVRHQQQSGFTLLEVLIAVSILTLVVTGAMQLGQQRMKTLAHVEEKLAATVIIGNLLQDYRLQGSPLEPTETEGEVSMGDWQFQWRRQIESQATQRRHRIVMQIYVDEDLIQDRTWYKSL